MKIKKFESLAKKNKRISVINLEDKMFGDISMQCPCCENSDTLKKKSEEFKNNTYVDGKGKKRLIKKPSLDLAFEKIEREGWHNE